MFDKIAPIAAIGAAIVVAGALYATNPSLFTAPGLSGSSTATSQGYTAPVQSTPAQTTTAGQNAMNSTTTQASPSTATSSVPPY